MRKRRKVLRTLSAFHELLKIRELLILARKMKKRRMNTTLRNTPLL
jgi:hypothetical protein